MALMPETSLCPISKMSYAIVQRSLTISMTSFVGGSCCNFTMYHVERSENDCSCSYKDTLVSTRVGGLI